MLLQAHVAEAVKTRFGTSGELSITKEAPQVRRPSRHPVFSNQQGVQYFDDVTIVH